jgi:hypothetical protein
VLAQRIGLSRRAICHAIDMLETAAEIHANSERIVQGHLLTGRSVSSAAPGLVAEAGNLAIFCDSPSESNQGLSRYENSETAKIHILYG